MAHNGPGAFSGGYCYYAFSSLYVATDGTVAPCCEFQGVIGNVQETSLLSIWKSESLADLRQKFKGSSLPAGCQKCIDREKHEGASMRLDKLRQLGSLEETFDVSLGPKKIDFRFSNLCNLRCRTCGPAASSKWYSDGRALGYKLTGNAEIKSFDGDFRQQIEEVLDGLEEIHFAGGEPLLSEDHYRLLEMLISRGKTAVNLTYNTNMTVLSLGRWNVLEMWSQFPNITVIASVDAAKDRGALIRSGFDWSLFCTNVKEIKRTCPHIYFMFGITVSIFNILTITELLSALEKECDAAPASFAIHSLQDPTFYRTQVLPPKMKIKAAQRIRKYIEAGPGRHDDLNPRLQGLVDYMNAEDRSEEILKVRHMSERLDSLRNEKTGSALPELSTILKDAGKVTAWWSALLSLPLLRPRP